MTRAHSALLAFLGLTLSSTALAGQIQYRAWYQACRLPIESILPRAIGVGCQVMGAAYGCSPGKSLELRIDFKAPQDARAEARLEFIDFSFDEGGVRVPSTVRRSGNVLTVKPGVTRLRAFKVDASPAPLIRTELVVSENWLESVESAGTMTAREVELHFTQIAGGRTVNEHTLIAGFAACPLNEYTGDRVAFTGNDPTRNAIALVDGREAACFRDRVAQGVSHAFVGNLDLSPPASCESTRVTAYARGKAMEIVPDASATWKPPPTDVLPITLRPPLVLDVMLWIFHDRCEASRPAFCTGSSADIVNASIARANEFYAAHYAGIAFNVIGVQELPASLLPAGSHCRTQSAAQLLKSSLSNIKSTHPVNEADGTYVDLLFVEEAGNAFGFWCGAEEPEARDILLLTNLAGDHTLSHELGHALLDSDAHVNEPNSTDGFDDQAFNLMGIGSSSSRYLTLGQIFRMNLLPGSPLVRHGKRPAGDAVQCLEFVGGDCPKACFDVIRNCTDASCMPKVNSGGPQCGLQ